MKILITGGAGYIGSHVVNQLGKNGHDLTIIDNLSNSKKDAVLYGDLIIEDIGNRAYLRRLMMDKKFDACFHFAGFIVVPESIINPLKYYENNTLKSQNLIDLCVEHGIERFIFSSTAAVYGDVEGGSCSETTPLRPMNAYGRSKLMIEWILEDVSRIANFNYISLRYFNVAGANVEGKIGQSTPNATHLIKIASECASGKRSEMEIFGDDYNTKDGTCVRDYIHVDDLAQAHLASLDYLTNHKESQILNCGYGHGYSVKEVIESVKRVTQKDFKVSVGPRRDGDASTLISIVKNIKTILDWSPSYDNLDLIVQTAYEWENKIP